MNIGLYFGSFNPVHVGHLIIAEYVATHTEMQQVWFVVSPQNPFKKQASLLNEYDRLHFVNIAIENNEKLRASDIEFKLTKPSYTVTTVAYLQEKYPQHRFSIIIGSDSFLNLANWYNYEVLISAVDFIVYERPGFPVNEQQMDSRIHYRVLKNTPVLHISATYIRDCIREKKSVRYLVHDKVLDEIEKSGYYAG